MKHVIASLFLLGSLAPGLALASEPTAQVADERPAFSPEAMAGWRTTRLGQMLNLSVADTAKLGETLKPFDAQRAPLHQQMKEAFQTLKAAEAGDATAATQIDAATAKIFDAQTKMAALRQQELAAVSNGLTPAQKAKAAMFYAHEGRHGHGKWMKHHQQTQP